MKNAFLNENGTQLQISQLGKSADFQTGVIQDAEVSGVIRVKALEDARIRLANDSSVGVSLSEGETEYFNIGSSQLEVVEGSVNIMY